MSETVTIAAGKLAYLEERAKKLAREKSYLQLVICMMNRVSAASGLDDTVDCMLRNTLDVVGGTDLVLYYWIDSDIFRVDVNGSKIQLDAIDDEQVLQARISLKPIEFELEFSETQLTTTEFTKGFTWVYPLLIGQDLIGILKMERLHLGMRGMEENLSTFFNYAALILKNEILGHTELQLSIDQLNRLNEELHQEIAAREVTEEALRQSRNELEHQVGERTAELHVANEMLQKELDVRINTQKELRRNSEEVQDLYNNAPCGYHSLDKDGTFVRINDTELRWLGYTRDEIIGKKFSDFVTESSQQKFRDNFPRFMAEGFVKDLEFEMLRKDGTILPTLLSATALYDESGTFLMSRSTLYDITGQMHVEEQIRQLNKELTERVETKSIDLETKHFELEESQLALMNIVEDLNLKTAELEEANTRLLELDQLKSMFIASMSHELRTPLNSIIGFSSIIRDGWLGQVNTEQKENLDTIQRAGKHLLSLINDVIDVSKIEAGRIEARFEEFDLYDLLTEAVQYVEKDINEKAMELTLRFQHHLLRTDKRRLLQCIINLLSNAVKFTEHGGITVSSATAENRQIKDNSGKTTSGSATVCITISDTGIGIEPEDIPKIFEPFVRLESHLKTLAPGTGLGLYLTKKLVVEVLGGDILCTSSIGSGSTFNLTIPERIYEKGTGS